MLRGYGLSRDYPASIADQVMGVRGARPFWHEPAQQFVRRHLCTDDGMLKAEVCGTERARPTVDGLERVRAETLTQVHKALGTGTDLRIKDLAALTGLSTSRLTVVMRWLEHDGRAVMVGTVGNTRTQLWRGV